MKEPTHDMVVDFWHYMNVQFGSDVVEKKDSVTIRAISSALEMFKGLDSKAFMKDFVTTIGRTIYVPFILGEVTNQWSLWDQMRVCIHEHEHVAQYDKDGAEFSIRYLQIPAERARYESAAYLCDAAAEFWRTGEIMDSVELAGRLRAYSCSEGDIKVAQMNIALCEESIKAGATISRSMHVARTWLDQFAQGIREV